MRTGSTLSYLLSDSLGSSTIALSSTGSIVAVQLYAPFGTSRYSLGTMPTTYNFTGQRLDSETGLLYYGARYYDPFSARFVQADSAQSNASGMDPYAYVGENPETYLDPFGAFYAPTGGSGSQSGPVLNDCYQPSCDGGGTFGEGGGGEGGDESSISSENTDPATNTGKPPETNPGNEPGVDPITPEEGAQLDAALQEGEQLVNELKTAEQQFGNEFDLQPGEEVSDLNPDETTPNGPGTTSTSTDANPGGIQYFFRGTSKGYPGNPSLQRLGVSPASTDPVVSTVFATESDAFGEGVVYIATPEDLSGVEIGPGNVRAELESEVSVWISPSECAERASMSVDSGDARSILESMGISIPRSINTREFGTGVLQGSPRLSSQEIEQFIQLVRKLLK